MTRSRPGSRLQRGRMALTVLDQGLSTVTNAVLLIAVSSQEPAAVFGDFAIAYGVVAFVLGFQRAGVGDAFLVEADEAGGPGRADGGLFTRNVLASAVLGAGLLALSGLVVGGVLGAFLLWFGLLGWAVLAQDGLRFYAMARARPAVAALMDGLWLLVLGGGALLLPDVGGLDAVRLWGLGAVIGLGVGVAVLRPPLPRWSGGLGRLGGWIRGSFALEFAVVTFGGLALLTGLRVFIGPEATAAIAAVVAIYQPAHSVLAGLRLYYLPRLTARRGTPDYGSEIRGWMAVVVAVLVGWLLLGWLARDLLEVLLGDTWEEARPVLLAGAAFELCNGLGALRADHLKVSGRGQPLVAGRVVFVGLFLLAALVGGVLADVEGAATGRAVGAAVGLAAWMAIGTAVHRGRGPVTSPAGGVPTDPPLSA